MAVLLDVLRALPDGDLAGRAAAADWQGVSRRAWAHGVAPLFWHAIQSADVEPPADARARLDGATAEAAMWAARVRATLRAALEALGRASIPAIVLKGWPFALRMFPRPELRTMTDVDLLVREDDAAAAVASLVAAGGRLTEGAPRARYRERHHHHAPPIVGVGSATVELHFRAMVGFGAVLDAEPLFDRAVADRIDGLAFLRPSAEDEALYLAAHAAGHLYARLGWLLDLKLVARQGGVDWERVAAQARATGFAAALELAAHLLARVGVEIGIRRRRLAPRFLARAEERLEAAWYADHRYPMALALASLGDTPLRAGRFLAHHALFSARRRLARLWPRWVPEAWSG